MNTTTTGLYHGTRTAFRAGGYLLPPEDHNGAVRAGGDGSTGWVYLTDDVDLARWYAEQGTGTSAPRVLECLPLGEVFMDRSHYVGEESQYRTRWAKVLRIIKDTPSAGADSARTD